MIIRSALAAALGGLLLAAPALADHSHGQGHGQGHAEGHGHAASTGELTVTGAVARASLGAAPNSAVYLTVSTSGAADILTGAASPVATAVEIHESRTVDGVMQMGRVEGVPVAAGADAVLAPGGFHIMLIGLHAPLAEGTTIPLTLSFASGAEITLEVPVSKDVAGHGH